MHSEERSWFALACLLALLGLLASALFVRPSWVVDHIPVGAVDPPLADLYEFPIYEATQQAERCQEHLRRLRALRGSRGYEGGRGDAWIAQAESNLVYWQLLEAANDSWFEPVQRRFLALLKERLGALEYGKRWRPPLCPGSQRFWDEHPVVTPLALLALWERLGE